MTGLSCIQGRSRRNRLTLVSIAVILSLLATLCPQLVGLPLSTAEAANPAPVQVYYVTLPEADALRVLDAINSAADTPITTYFSIAIGVSGTYIYYDQWENGYDSDIANPTNLYSASNPGGTQIWGNGEADDGCAPNKNGAAITCTDANDVFVAGDVIIPDNTIALTGFAASYVLDGFGSAAYNLNSGNVNWATSWVETNDDGSPSAGSIYITSGVLRFRSTTGIEAGDSIARGVTLPTGGACAALSFTLGQSGIDANEDRLAVQVSGDGGTSYTTLEVFDNAADASAKWYDVAAYATNTRVRFLLLDELETGEYWSVDNVQVAWGCPVRDPSAIYFDGKDKIAATSSIAMARAAWAGGSGTLNGFAHEMYTTAEWGTAYEAPVGVNTANAGQMFEFSGLSIMAAQNNTTVQIDADANGSYETSVTLQEGGSTLVTGILQGARVQADRPIQVLLATGDVGSSYASRDMNLLPVSAWGSSYWSPVGVVNSTNNTRLFLYNLSTNSSIYITCERYGAANTTLGPVAARGVVTVDLTNGQGARCYASTAGGAPTTDKISAVGTVDTTGTAYDWSFTLYPDDFLSTEALVGLGLGRDPTSATNPTENGNPLWVTTVCSGGTYVYVDWNNDGTADLVDLNGDGDTLDTVGGISESTSNNGMLVARLQSVRLFEPPLDSEPYDQSGALVWSRTASGVGRGGTPGCPLALAWGQDPATASAGAPGLDVGTSVPPLRLIEGAKSLELKTDSDGDGVLSPGDVATYIIAVRNASGGSVSNVYVYDAAVPDKTDYNTNTTQKNVGSGWVSIPDDTSGTPFPLDATPNGVLLGTSLPAGTTWYVRFDVTLKNINVAGVYEEIENCDITYTSAGTVQSCVTNLVASNDWGDLPDSYGTSLAADGPRHSLSDSGLVLGASIDRDLQGQPTTAADGDDTNRTPDDEDGVTIANTAAQWEAGNGAFSVTVANGPGCLNAWMDFTDDSAATPPAADGNFTKAGGYDTYSTYSEHIIQNVKLNTGTTNVGVTVPPGLASAAVQYYYVRFRLSPTDGSGNCTAAIAPTGFVAGGEVEDYRFDLPDLGLASLGDRVWLDEDGDGVQDDTEAGIAGVVVYIDANDNAARDPDERYATTDSNGNYTIDQLAAGTYTVRVDRSTVPAGYYPTYDLDGGLDCVASVPLTTGQTRTDVDFGYKLGLVAGIISPDPLQTEAVPGDTVWFVQSWTNLGDMTDRGNITVYDIPSGWGVVVYRDASGSAPAVGVHTSLSCPSTTCLEVATESSGDRTILDNNDTIVGAQDTGSDGVPDSGDLASGGGTTKVILKVTIPSGALPGTYALRERGSSNNDWTRNYPALAYNNDIIYHDEALKIVTIPGAALGDRVWLDEDSDGVQDAGEPGIANVKVTATWAGPDGDLGTTGDNVTYTTWTDAEGRYIFTNLPAGNYQVTVDTSTLAGGLAANPTFDLNGIGTPHTATLSLTAGQTFTQADFGYNWAATTDVDNGTGTGAIAGTIWSDAGDGVLNPGEAGLAGISVALWYDSDNDGVIDAVYPTNGTTTTDANGNYVLDDLPAGIYEVRVTAPSGYTQTRDPDAIQDSQTTVPIVLAPGDVYLNADFGYRPDASSTIGDTIYFDANGDGVFDGSDYGIPGVTVALLNSDGKIIATTVTDANGHYSFAALPAGTYTVWVNDTANVLGDLAQTADPDTTLDGRHTLTVDGASAYLANDFGYAPAGHSQNTGLIGDTIYLDRDGQNDYDPGEGLQGVKVKLYDSTGTILLATTTTDENGHYYFGGLADGTYVVVVDTGTLPAGLTNTVDPDGGLNSQATVTISNRSVNLLQDFGYQGTNTVAGTIWTDLDADGFMDDEETGWLAGVTVVLRDSNGNIVATAITDENGGYTFSRLPNGTYTVDVTDQHNVLDGYWHSLGTANSDGHSQSDPLTVTLSGDTTIVYADFGYYRLPAGLGDRVWWDQDKDGIQDASEPGLDGAVVTLTISWPGGGSTRIRTTTADGGYYRFDNLLLDEDHDGTGGGEPTYAIAVVQPEGYPYATTAGAGDDRTIDSGLASGESITAIQGSVNDTYDYGFYQTPLAVQLASFTATATADGVILAWETVSEVDVLGFNLYRAIGASAGSGSGSKWLRLNAGLIEAFAPGSSEGHHYTWLDTAAQPGASYCYRLEGVDMAGRPADLGETAVASARLWSVWLPLLYR